MMMKLLIAVLLISPLFAAKPFRLMDNQELLQWYLQNPTDDTKVIEKFGQNQITVRRIPATNSVQKIIELWSPAEKKFKTMTINLKYYRDPTTGWETLQGLTCPLPPRDTPPEVDECVKGSEVADKVLRLLLSAKIQDPQIEKKVGDAAECIKSKVNLPRVELNCFMKALTPENIKLVKKELMDQLHSQGLDVVGGKVVKHA